ncbi:MAG: rod shape-determining protein MreC [Gemmatimonadota bacterium]
MPHFEPDINDSGGRRDLVLALVFVALSVLLMILPSVTQQQLSLAMRSTVLAPFLRLQETVQQARIRSGSVLVLQAQLDSALAVLHSQSTLEEENERLRTLLELRARGSATFVSATAIRPGTQGSESMFLLDVGEADGVEVNAPVVVADGLVGVVREVGPRSALAMDWTHPDFRVSAMTVGGAVFGIVEPRRGIFREEDRLMLNGVPYHTSVQPGVPIVTSGQGSVYPRGILVGTIDSLAETEAGWRRSYWLEPAVRPGSATHVLVITGGVTPPADSLQTLWLPRERLPDDTTVAVEDEGPPPVEDEEDSPAPGIDLVPPPPEDDAGASNVGPGPEDLEIEADPGDGVIDALPEIAPGDTVIDLSPESLDPEP